ncbi:Zn(II)2Cys6 transcription factor domain-containing protein [Aspergillus stella-maris]|uniref:Zn(II)2Cys6 transcription factor domain-containing protein n=1 Tax=Aspergillus stella-maris TaxID=1810926 RepID=UPI003CCE2B1C
MPPSQIRRSRKDEIPSHLVQSWQASDRHGAKTAVRRPVTACDTCRSAKVRCKGRHNSCDRCITKGIQCRFSSLPSRIPDILDDSSTGSLSNTVVPIDASSPVLNGTNNMLAVGELGGLGMPDLNAPLIEQPPSTTMVDWSRGIPSQLFDWPSLDWSEYTIDPTLGLQSNDLGLSQPSIEHASHGESSSNTSSTVDNSSKLSCASQSRQAEDTCQCRADLMAQVPKVKDAMEKPSPQLDQILNVTFKVLFVCRNLIVCTKCQISYADLVCVVAVLQQTETGLEHIAEQGLNNDYISSTIKISMGDYDVPFGNQATLRHALVMDLVATANCLLDKLRLRSEALAEKESQSASTAQSRLTRINMNYLQEVVKSFESTLRSIASSLEGSK